MSKDSYKAFGRGTPAGNAVYNLYNGKKNMDSTLDPDLLARLQKMRKERDEMEKNTVKPKVVPKSQAYVNVPKPTNGRKPPSAEQVAEWRLQALGRRKRMNEILVDIASGSGGAKRDVPQYDKPARTEADKTRLQQIMEHGEELRPMERLPKVLENMYSRQKTRRDILGEEFERLSSLITEKRADLREVQKRQVAAVQTKTLVEGGAKEMLAGGGGEGSATATSVSNAALAALRAEEVSLLREIGQLVADMKSVDKDLSSIPEDED